MAGFSRPWFLAGGWAIDLWLGRVTRHHEDAEIAIFREDQAEIRRHLAGWTFDKVADTPEGHRALSWREEERLELPIHEIHARGVAGDLRDLEILLNESDRDVWRFRRDQRVTLPISEAGLFMAGIPILAPEIVLLFKAKTPRPRDEPDFRNALARLTPAGRTWLRGALEMAHPGHPWIAAL